MGDKYEEGWHWIASPEEGDVWYPILIRSTDFLMGDQSCELSDLDLLIVRKAKLPEFED